MVTVHPNTVPQDLNTLRELNILTRISQGLISTLDYEKVLQIISDGMSELLDIETAAIYILEESGMLTLSATTPPLDPGLSDELKKADPADHPHIQKAIFSRQSIILEDTGKTELSVEERNLTELRQLRSLLFFPMVHENKVLGVLILGTCNKSRKFTENEIILGQTIANQLSISVQNARLHADLKVHKEKLELLVLEKTKDLDAAIKELKSSNDVLSEKNFIINEQNTELKLTLLHLRSTQSQLLLSEKMASLGTLTAGIAHEINNPLNFLTGSYNGFIDYFRGFEGEKSAELLFLMENRHRQNYQYYKGPQSV